MKIDLEELGWDEERQLVWAALGKEKWKAGRVMRENRGKLMVNLGDGALREAQLPGAFRSGRDMPGDVPTVGDWLALEAIEGSESLFVRQVLERRSALRRQVAGSESKLQVIAANIDFLFLVCGLDRDFNLARIQRMLTLAWESGAQPIVILNKSDVCDSVEEKLSLVRGVALGAPVFALASLEGKGLEQLEPYLTRGKTVALMGSSGVGKSTLVNALLGIQRMATQSNRAGDSRGRHTTTWGELSRLPGGGILIDLPGMRELQLTGEVAGLEKAFADVRAIASGCRFRNCRHGSEPGCAIEEALRSGEISEDRFRQYQKLSVESSIAKKRRGERIRKESVARKTRPAKAAFLKELGARKRKEQKARRKGGEGWA